MPLIKRSRKEIEAAQRFQHLAPEPPAVIPFGARGRMRFLTVREEHQERLRELAHWTHRLPQWLEKHLKRWFYTPGKGSHVDSE